MESPVDTFPKPAFPFLRAIPYLFGRNTPLDALRRGRDVSFLAALLLLGLYIARDWWLADPARYFSTEGFSPYFTELLFIGVFAYSISRSANCVLSLGILLSLLLEVYFFLMLMFSGLSLIQYHYSTDKYNLYYGLFAYGLLTLALLGVLTRALPQSRFKAVAAVIGFVVATYAADYFLEYGSYSFWYHDYSGGEEESVADPIQDYEQVFFSQDKLLQQELDKIPPGVEGVKEYFYLGFGSYAEQAVFKKEVQYVNRLFDEKYSTQEHGLVLINNRETLEEYPLAIRHNLRRALQGIAQKMNRDEDVLFLYLTSHGSHDHDLAVSFEPFQFESVTPPVLKQALDDSGIHWKVVIISACFSGGFVESLQDPYTLIATAADADHESFGCSNENDFTYFGEALFRDQLAKGIPLLQALPLAKQAIADREKQENLAPSNPQIWIGEAIGDYLKNFELQ